jgi:hypothetical protein
MEPESLRETPHSLDSIPMRVSDYEDLAVELRPSRKRVKKGGVAGIRQCDGIRAQRAIGLDATFGVGGEKVEIWGNAAGSGRKDVGIAQGDTQQHRRPPQCARNLGAKAEPTGVTNNQVRTELFDGRGQSFPSEPDGAVGSSIIRPLFEIQRVAVFVSVIYANLCA